MTDEKTLIGMLPAEVRLLADFYKAEIREVEPLLMPLLKRYEFAKQRLAQFDADYGVGRLVNVYEKTMTLVAKAEYVLLARGTIASTREIAEAINTQEGSTMSPAEIKDLVNNLAATLKQKVDKQNTFARNLSRSGEFYYGLVSWYHPSHGFSPSYRGEVILTPGPAAVRRVVGITSEGLSEEGFINRVMGE